MNVEELSTNAWRHLNNAQPREAAACFQHIPAAKRNPSDTMGFGLSLMASGDYDRANAYFSSLNEEKPKFSAKFYEMAGVSEWCLGEHAAAVQDWKSMTTCGYGDGANHVSAGLLIYFAAFRQPGLVTLTHADEFLKKRLAKRAAGNWPGPVARFLVREISESELEEIWQSERYRIFTRIEVDFYIGVRRAVDGDPSAYRENLAKWASHLVDDSIIYHPEFYLSKCELSRGL